MCAVRCSQWLVCHDIKCCTFVSTGELFAFGYNVGKAPYCTVSTFDPKGNMLHDVPVTLRGPVMMHDCAMTEVCSGKHDEFHLCGHRLTDLTANGGGWTV